MKLVTTVVSHTHFKFSIMLAASAAILSSFLLIGAGGSGPTTELISIGVDGQAGSGDAYYVGSEITAGAVSADGRFVVFSSLAENLTDDDVSGWHIYLRDRFTDTTTLVADGSNSGGSPVISADGRYIAFRSLSSQLVANDNNGIVDIFVYETANGSIKRVSVASDGTEGTGCSCGWPDSCNGCEYDIVNAHPSISGDGRYITFTSFSSNFVDGDLPDTPDVFLHDQQTGETSIISLASDGNLGNDSSGEPSISTDGNSIAFSSAASNLIAEDWNDQRDVFLWRRGTVGLTRVSVATDGTEGNSTSTDPVISADGNRIAFTSGATTLATNDTNGFIYDIFLRDLEKGTTTILSSGLAGGGDWPAISDNGESVSFNSGSDDIYLFNLVTGQRQLINERMQHSALNENGSALVLSGYDNMLAIDTNNDKDVYLVSLDGQEPPDGEEPPVDGEPPVGDDGQPVDDQSSPEDDAASNDTDGDTSSSACSYSPNSRFDPVLPVLLLLAIAYLAWNLRKKERTE